MKRLVLFVALSALSASCAAPETAGRAAELVAWDQQAANVTIVRDTWGIPHVYGKTDADAVARS